jgi:hypothetical protein
MKRRGLWTEFDEWRLGAGVEPLNVEERAWLDEFAAAMERMPARLVVFETAGSVYIADRRAAREAELEDGKAREAGVLLASVDVAACDIVSAAG